MPRLDAASSSSPSRATKMTSTAWTSICSRLASASGQASRKVALYSLLHKEASEGVACFIKPARIGALSGPAKRVMSPAVHYHRDVVIAPHSPVADQPV